MWKEQIELDCAPGFKLQDPERIRWTIILSDHILGSVCQEVGQGRLASLVMTMIKAHEQGIKLTFSITELYLGGTDQQHLDLEHLRRTV